MEDIAAFLPKYEFRNHTQKQITFSLFTDSDEQYSSTRKNDTDNDPNDQVGREKFVFSIEPEVDAVPKPRDGDEGKDLEQAIEELFSGLKKD